MKKMSGPQGGGDFLTHTVDSTLVTVSCSLQQLLCNNAEVEKFSVKVLTNVSNRCVSFTVLIPNHKPEL